MRSRYVVSRARLFFRLKSVLSTNDFPINRPSPPSPPDPESVWAPATRIARKQRPPATTRCVVTGAAGFLGSHVCEALLKRGDDVIGLDCFPSWQERRLKEANLTAPLTMGLQFHEVDLTRRKVHKLLAHADVVFHMDGYADEHGVEPENRRLLSAQIGHDLVGTARLTET